MELRVKSIALVLAVAGLIGSIRPAMAHSMTFDFAGTVVTANPHSLGGIFTVPILSYIGHVTSLSASAMPIPAAVYLFGSGLAAIAAFARRKSK